MIGSKIDLQDFGKLVESGKSTTRTPALFVGHGSPMNAIETNRFTQEWERIGKQLPKPRAILSISAHWLTRGATKVTGMAKPRTIHDFGGFPQELFDVQYPALGSPEVADETIKAVTSKHILIDDEWGFDHGTWSVLNKMYPQADVPVLQLSIDYSLSPAEHYALAQELKKLRTKGIMILGSGNIVHNLRAIDWTNSKAFDWAEEFDSVIAKAIAEGDHQTIIDFQNQKSARMAHPTYDHFLPLLYVLGVEDPSDSRAFFNEGIDMGSISMRSFTASAAQ